MDKQNEQNTKTARDSSIKSTGLLDCAPTEWKYHSLRNKHTGNIYRVDYVCFSNVSLRDENNFELFWNYQSVRKHFEVV